MALSIANLGRIDLPGPLQFQPSQPMDLSCFIVDITYQAADYSTGLLLTTLPAALGVTAIVAVSGITVKIAAGTTQFGIGLYDVTNNKIRYFSAIATQTSATDYTAANGDVMRCVVFAI